MVDEDWTTAEQIAYLQHRLHLLISDLLRLLPRSEVQALVHRAIDSEKGEATDDGDDTGHAQ
jgi:hypothetical protein